MAWTIERDSHRMEKKFIIERLKKLEQEKADGLQYHWAAMFHTPTEYGHDGIKTTFNPIKNDRNEDIGFTYYVTTPTYDRKWSNTTVALKSHNKFVIARRYRKIVRNMVKRHRLFRDAFKDVTHLERVTREEYWGLYSALTYDLNVSLMLGQFDGVEFWYIAPNEMYVAHLSRRPDFKIQPVLIDMGDGNYFVRRNPLNLAKLTLKPYMAEKLTINRHFSVIMPDGSILK